MKNYEDWRDYEDCSPKVATLLIAIDIHLNHLDFIKQLKEMEKKKHIL